MLILVSELSSQNTMKLDAHINYLVIRKYLGPNDLIFYCSTIDEKVTIK